MQMLFNVTMTDHPDNVDGAQVPFTVKVTLNNKVFTFNQNITVALLATNIPVLDHAYSISGLSTPTNLRG